MSQKKSVDYSLITRHYILQKDLNAGGSLYGGVMLSWLDEAGYILASELAGCTNMATVALHNVQFKAPARLGDLIEIYGKLVRIGKTSITVNIMAETYSVVQNIRMSIIECEIVFVKIDGNGKPTEINQDRRVII